MALASKLRATSEAAALSDLIKITIDLVSEWVACHSGG